MAYFVGQSEELFGLDPLPQRQQTDSVSVSGEAGLYIGGGSRSLPSMVNQPPPSLHRNLRREDDVASNQDHDVSWSFEWSLNVNHYMCVIFRPIYYLLFSKKTLCSTQNVTLYIIKCKCIYQHVAMLYTNIYSNTMYIIYFFFMSCHETCINVV